MSLLQAAQTYLSNYFSVIAVNQYKKSIFNWQKYQSAYLSEQDAKEQFSHPDAHGLAVVCGAISGNLELIDLDLDNDITGTLYENFCSDVISNLGVDFIPALRIVRSRSGGVHWYYRCSTIEGNQKLARRASTAQELSAAPDDKVKVLIETRGNGGYVVAPPTPNYEIIQKNMPPTITPEQRHILLNIARSYNELLQEAPAQRQTSTSATRFARNPFQDYNERGDVEGLIQSHGWRYLYERNGRRYYTRPGKDKGVSGDWWPEKGWFTVLSTSTMFETGKAYRPAAVYCLLECGDDWSRCASQLLAAGYGEVLPNDPSKEQIKAAAADYEGPQLLTYWDTDPEKFKVFMNLDKFRSFLHGQGYRLYFSDPKTKDYLVIRIAGQIVDTATVQEVKQHILQYNASLPLQFDFFLDGSTINNLVLKHNGSIFGTSFREFFQVERPVFLEDTPTMAYIPFQNGILHITPDNITLAPYHQFAGHVWQQRIIQRPMTVLPGADLTQADFFRFLQAISGEAGQAFIGPRTEYAMRVFGYMLHGYRDESRPWAVILAEETESQEQGGGTGKGLFAKGLSEIVRLVDIDGKNFDRSANFAMQRVDVDSQIVFIDDVPKAFPFDTFYSDITGGLTIEKKHAHALRLPFEQSPKFIFSTNYDTGLTGSHALRRFKILEFAPFFGLEITPISYFGHRLFRDWDRDEWNRFYNICAICLQEYLIHGVPDNPPSDAMRRKTVVTKYGEQFADWLDDFCTHHADQWYSMTAAYNDFLRETGFTSHDYSMKGFSRAIQASCYYKNISFEKKRMGVDRATHFCIRMAAPDKKQFYFLTDAEKRLGVQDF